MRDDAIEFLEDYCEFGEQRVYLLMALARKAENEHLTKNTEIVFREVVKDEQDIPRKVEKLKRACRNFTDDEGHKPTFRLYLSVNARDTLRGYWMLRERMNGWIRDLMNDDDGAPRKFKKIDSFWKSELQRPRSRADERFVFDIDSKEDEVVDFALEALRNHTEVIASRETPNGYNVVTEPFNYNNLPKEFEDIDGDGVATDNMMFVSYLQRVENDE